MSPYAPARELARGFAARVGARKRPSACRMQALRGVRDPACCCACCCAYSRPSACRTQALRGCASCVLLRGPASGSENRNALLPMLNPKVGSCSLLQLQLIPAQQVGLYAPRANPHLWDSPCAFGDIPVRGNISCPLFCPTVLVGQALVCCAFGAQHYFPSVLWG